MLKTQVDKKHFNNKRIIKRSYSDPCFSGSRSKQNKFSEEGIQKECINIENTFLYKIPHDRLQNFYKYQFYNYSLQAKKTEWDTIMIIPEYNAIINIEVKLGPKDCGDKLELLKDSSEQTKKHFAFMQKIFGGMLSKDWMFVRAACVPYLEIAKDSKRPCINCQQFILQDVIYDVKPWLKQLIKYKLTNYHNDDQTEYEDLVAELLFHISIKESSRFEKLIVDPLIISKETEKALTGKVIGISGESYIPVHMLTDEHLTLKEKTEGESSTTKTMLTGEQQTLTEKTAEQSGKSSPPKTMLTNEQQALTGKIAGQSDDSFITENVLSDEDIRKADATPGGSDVPVYMLNNEQLQAVNSPAKFLIIDGDYGTGKTYILKDRAKKCAADNHENQIFYLDFTTLPYSRAHNPNISPSLSSVMEKIAQADFDTFSNIRVVTIRDLFSIEDLESLITVNEIEEALNSFLRYNHCDHLFIDEMISTELTYPTSIKTICLTLKVIYKGKLAQMYLSINFFSLGS